MKALRCHGEGDVRVDDIPRPAPGQGQALVRVRLSGLCGTDLLVLSGRYEPAKHPITLGHEFVGEVVAVGAGVDAAIAGTRVAAEASWPCGSCPECRQGSHACTSRVSLGRSADGCFAEYVALPAAVLHPVPDDVPDRAAQALVTIATSAKAVARSQRGEQPEPTTVVGTGHAGLLMAGLLARTGGVPLVVVGTRQGRLDLARAAGATATYNVRDLASREQLEQRIAGGGLGPVTIEATGTGEGLGTAIGCTTASGLVVAYSIYPSTDSVGNLDRVYSRELTITGSRGGAGFYEAALESLASGQVDAAALTGEPVPLADGPELLEAVQGRAVAEPRPLLLGG